MSTYNSQNEPKLPLSKSEKRTSANLLPRFYRTDSNKKFLQSTIDQLVQPGTVKKINGFIGRKNAKSNRAEDLFLPSTDNNRDSYQLESAAVIRDYFGNINFYKDYIDHINHIHVFGGNVDKHDRINEQEFYSWNPHINWDKFVNYQNYYWLPYGPPSIRIAGQQQEIVSTYQVTLENQGDNYVYVFSPDGLTKNPTITLYRGQTYKFEISAKGQPFTIKTSRISGSVGRYTTGVSDFSVENGTITFTVDAKAPDVLYYVSDNNDDTAGVFHVLGIDNNTYLDVEKDILGKKNYTVSANETNSEISLSNGMKVFFTGKVIPEKYASGRWYVDGVGSGITLISEKELEVSSTYTADYIDLFDDTPFDTSPYSSSTSFPRDKDYYVINRGSLDRNSWSRYNRWFHQDVIVKSYEALSLDVILDQSGRATRPIIEFNTGLKLYNFGHRAKANVDLIDTFTTDIFSTIEGSQGYNIDGIDVGEGMRILFAADADITVRGKIFKVKFVKAPSTALMRTLSFRAFSGVNLANNTIQFATPHDLQNTSQVIYVNNNNASIKGLVHRQVYYIEVVDPYQVRLYDTYSPVAGFGNLVSLTVRGSGTHMLETFSSFVRQITLVEEEDATPILNETVLVNQGVKNQGLMYWFNGTDWVLGQVKTTVNQPPLFDVFDSDGYSFGDQSVYVGSTFTGTQLFSYKTGTGVADTELGFPLSYQNINNIGDILFSFNLSKDSFTYKIGTEIFTKTLSVGYLRYILDIDNYSYVNGWTKSSITNTQPIVRIFKGSELVNNFPIDVFEDVDKLNDLTVKVYINEKRLDSSLYEVVTGAAKKFVKLVSNINENDVLSLKCYSSQPKNANGYYEFPINLQNNPLNEDIEEFTLGEVIDHVSSIVDNITDFTGQFPGQGNLRDLGNVSHYGTRFVQHSSPLNLSLYHLGSKTSNVYEAIEKARNDYANFKRAFIIAASNSGIEAETKQHVDYVLDIITRDKSISEPYYLSDMFGFKGENVLEYTVLDSRTKVYPLTEAFNLSNLSNKSVLLYLNGIQMVHGQDYVFGDDVFFTVLRDLTEGDIITAYEYVTTDGSFCPPTPTKLGLYPKFLPKKFVDDTYLEPTEVIQGHDGSITIAFGDYRDDLILELETRIYNNLKMQYDSSIFDIYDYVPGYNRSLDYSKEEFEKVLSTYFYQWASTVNQDYTKQTVYDRFNPFTFNYRDNYAPDGTEIPAHWRGIYKWILDTDRPHVAPWEMLGFSEEPSWWTTVYGVAPYTSDNQLLWNDIKMGNLRVPGEPVRILEKFARPIIETSIPVDKDGILIDPLTSQMAAGLIKSSAEGYFVFGDQAPVETAWRRSSYYPFALIQTALLLKPSKVLGTCLDRSRIVKNNADQFVYSETGLRIRLSDIVLPSTTNSDSRVFTAGLINYVVEFITGDITNKIENYKNDLTNLTNSLGSKLGGFTAKNKFKLLLDSKSPTSSGSIFVPEENYNIFFNVSSPIKKLVYSGVIITKFADGFEIRGYNVEDPYFSYHPYLETDRVIRIGGISETFSEWQENKYYVAGKIVRSGGQYYRVKKSHQSITIPNSEYYTRLAELPINGGREAILRKSWDFTTVESLSYGTKLATVQEVADFIQGYSAYLVNQGFIFDEYNSNFRAVTNWENSLKEFLFWTTQNWAVGSVISLSPAANKLSLKSSYSVVNDIKDPFYKYQIFRVDGQKLEPDFTNVFRDENSFTLVPENTNHGIYGASLYLVQKEHVVVIDNKTMFNDVIYDMAPGYRQERIKVVGYMSINWNGSFDIPGFVFDQARTDDWEPWVDYRLGQIVKYKEFYYTAKKFLPGAANFNPEDWVLQEEKPTARLLPNWDYRAEQFTDFYDLDTDNFDSEQQRMAQHLIGYQPRQYLQNIISDSVSEYKFYQGMIIEKGTQNVFNKLFDVLSAADKESLEFNEEWAIRVGQYGAVSTFEEIEFNLDDTKFKIKPQPIELTSTIDPSATDFVYRQLPSDIYIRPLGYNNNPWPTGNTKQYLRTPGYVRYEDVFINIDTLNDIVDYSIEDFREGYYVWCAFEGRDWNVYRFTKNYFTIVNVSYQSNTLIVECDTVPNLVKGDVLGITNSPLINGFYIIDSVVNRTIYIKATISGWQDFEDSSSILTFTFKTQRVNHIDNANNILTNKLKNKELLWADNLGDDFWGVLENKKVYNMQEIYGSDVRSGAEFGKKVSVSPTDTYAAITDNSYVLIFKNTNNNWLQIQAIDTNPGIADSDSAGNPGSFGEETAFSPDDEWLAIAAPYASNVRYSNINDINVLTPYSEVSGLSEQGYVSLYRRVAGNEYKHVVSFASQTPYEKEHFGKNIAFAKKNNNLYLFVASPDADNQKGKISVYFYDGASWVLYIDSIFDVAENNEKFGSNFSVSGNGDTIVVGTIVNKVYILVKENNSYVLKQTLAEINSHSFGTTTSISSLGTYIAVGSPLDRVGSVQNGKVLVYRLTNGSYVLHQEIYTPSNEISHQYGHTVKFSDENRLLIYSLYGDVDITTSFDIYAGQYDSYTWVDNLGNTNISVYVSDPASTETNPTTFDNATTKFIDSTPDVGRVDVFERLHLSFIFGESLDRSFSSNQADKYGSSISVGTNLIIVSAPFDADESTVAAGSVYVYNKMFNENSWTVLYKQLARPNIEKIKKAYLYDKNLNELISYLDVVDPIQGRIPGPADQEIKFKTYFDPAFYSVGTSSVNVDDSMNWTAEQVGSLWWDLTRAKFLENLSGDIVYRTTAWNKLYESASIDIYEWIETKYLPSEWDKLADTEKGLTLGISGKSRYGDSVYSIKKKYDTISKTFSNTYYFWVKNKTIVPNISGRLLSAKDVANLIASPVSENYSCLALTGSNSFALINCENFLKGTDINLNVQYWTSDVYDSNVHSHWKLLSEHKDTILPANIESKWFHSLVGRDDLDNQVPDMNLPFKKRYGVEFRPRQSMFINRTEALKQFVERTNSVLKDILLIDNYDLSDLTQKESAPEKDFGVWDSQIDTYEEIRFIGTSNIQQASLIPTISGGKVVGAVINRPGKGYVNPPKIVINGSGSGAELQAVIDSLGQLVEVKVQDSGFGYNDNDTNIQVRPYSVLVNNDENSNGKWSIYTWNSAKGVWERTKSQSYDVTRFWNYIDWYAPGYSQYTKIDHVVDNTYQLLTLPADIGDIVRVKNIGSGGWVLFEKFDDIQTVDYTQVYNVVGRQNGTIKFLDILYTFKDLSGYDASLYDILVYDNSASKELKIILETIRDKILIGDLRVEYLKLFFASIRYTLTEQYLVDWAIKTSFVKAKHNVGSLRKDITYNNDNLSDFENYVNEVKPYRTKIREYVSTYNRIDYAENSVTDFDIIPTINANYEVNNVEVFYNENGEIATTSDNINQYPWKHWYDNSTFEVKEIAIVDGGSGYINVPKVTISGGFGQGAAAKAYISNGKLVKITLTSKGSGYLKAPTVTIEGGLSEQGIAATAVAIIENNLVRSNKVTIKFDRISRIYSVTELTETEQFIGTGSRVQYSLKWSPNLILGKTKVTVDGTEILQSGYTLSSKKTTRKGYTSYYGILTFTVAPGRDSVIEISYEKDFSHLSATDRINFYYNPSTNAFGKDLAQLMTGIDYGGVNIVGLGFGQSAGWDTAPWSDAAWDSFDATYDDYIVSAGENTYSYTLPYTPAQGELITVYVNGVRIDSQEFDGSTKVGNAIMSTFVGDGSTNSVQLPTPVDSPPLVLRKGDTVIFRKITSDGSYSSQTDYDTQLVGGNLEYTTATGYAPSDINVDGDGFITPTTSSAPEEVVPGHVADTLAIKVFHREVGGAPRVMIKSYVGDGSTNSFAIGQYFPSGKSVIVSVNNNIVNDTLYSIKWENNVIEFLTPPAQGDIIAINSISFSVGSLLDLVHIVADGNSFEFITKAPWLYSNLQSLVLINGTAVNYSLFRTDESYESPELVGVRFAGVIPAGSLISIMVYINDGSANKQQTPSIARSQIINRDGSTSSYSLTSAGTAQYPGYKLQPYESNVIVKSGSTILKPSDTIYFTMTNHNLSYTLPSYKYSLNTLNSNQIRVYSNKTKLRLGVDFRVDTETNKITINSSFYIEGEKLIVLVDVNYDYIITDNGTLILSDENVGPGQLEVISFYNHEILDINRTVDILESASTLVPGSSDYYTFNGKLGGKFVLPRPAISGDYVWVIKNGSLLTLDVDYLLDEDFLTIRLTTLPDPLDEIQIITFGNNVTTTSFGYMQFKDMLNRTHYKRISKAKTTRLVEDLTQYDIEIFVEDASVLDDPNKNENHPGIIEINGERIEYFTKVGNTLGQLRRGTLGTGVPNVHRRGLLVINFGSSETIPYVDQDIIETSTSDGSTTLVELGYTPTISNETWNRISIPTNYGQCNEIDVFVAGRRLKKAPYSMFEEINGYPDSPEGDTNFDAEFSVDGSNNSVLLTEQPDIDTKIVIVKKIGKLWNNLGDSMHNSSTEVAKFLKDTETIWPQYLVDKYQYVLLTDTRIPLDTDDGQPLELD